MPKAWSKCSWVLTTATTSPGAGGEVVDHSPGRLLRGVGVDHQQSAGAADERDVDVEPLVARDPHPVGDLDEPAPRLAHGRAYAPRYDGWSAEAGVRLAAHLITELGEGSRARNAPRTRGSDQVTESLAAEFVEE